MNKEEKKEYIKNIFEMVLSGEENFELAESLISSLNLRDDFTNYAHKEKDKRRAKNSFYKKEIYKTIIKGNRTKNLNEIRKATNEAYKINDFLVFLYFKWKREELKLSFNYKQKAPTK